MKKLIGIAALMLSLQGCTVAQIALQQDPELRAFAARDLEAAVAIATEAKDVVAAGCFQALKDHLPAERVSVEAAGPVSRYAKLRVAVRGARSDIPEAVHLACAPLVVDAGRTGAGILLLFK